MRQSSLLPSSVKAFDASRHPTRADVTPTSEGITIKLKWSKTLQRSCDLRVLHLPATQDPLLCPLRAYTRYTRSAPARSESAPLLALPDGNPATITLVTRLWKRALAAAHLSPALYSLHSLRRGAATYTHNDANAKLTDVMAQGTWRSMAVRDYITPAQPATNTVHQALSAL